MLLNTETIHIQEFLSFLGSETFSGPWTPSMTAQTPSTIGALPSHARSPSSHTENTHICPPRAARERITVDAMQGGGGCRREGFLFSSDCADSSTSLPSSTKYGPLDPKLHSASFFFFFFPHFSIRSQHANICPNRM